MYLPDRYKNLRISVEEEDVVSTPVKLPTYQPRFYLVLKDPMTGGRYSVPIEEPTPPPTPNPRIGQIRKDSLYIVQEDADSPVHTLRSPSRQEAIRRIGAKNGKVIRASIVCEGC